MYKDLFLGIREYDCDISKENLDKIIDIANKNDFDKDYPGFQSMFADLNESILHLLKESFISCCHDIFKISKKYDTRLWFYQDWKYNPHRDGQY